MRCFRAAIVPVSAIKGLLMARFANSMRPAAGKDPIGPDARGSVLGSSGLPACFLARFSGEATSGRTDGRM
jgi:hypothetical protein